MLCVFLFERCHGFPRFPVPVDGLGRIASVPGPFKQFGLDDRSIARNGNRQPSPAIVVISTFDAHEDPMLQVDDQCAIAPRTIHQPAPMIDPGRDFPEGITGWVRQLAESHPHIHPLNHHQIGLRLKIVVLHDPIGQYANLVDVPSADVFKTQKSLNWTASDRRYVT